MTSIPLDKAPKPGLNIYGCAAVNPAKLTIAAEELGVAYNYISLDMAAEESKSAWFASINPNGRLPAIVHVKADGVSVKVFESAACLLYLASEFDREHKLSYAPGLSEYWSQVSWLSWQISGYGPMMGEAAHYNRYAVESVPYGIWRYTAECRRLNHVLDKQLSRSPFVAGDRLTVADVAIFIYAYSAKWCGIDLDPEYPHVREWRDRLAQRPAFQRGLKVPLPYKFSDEAVSNPQEGDLYRLIRRRGGQMVKKATNSWRGQPAVLPSDTVRDQNKEQKAHL